MKNQRNNQDIFGNGSQDLHQIEQEIKENLHEIRLKKNALKEKSQYLDVVVDPAENIAISYEYMLLSQDYCKISEMSKLLTNKQSYYYLHKAKWCYLNALKAIFPVTGKEAVMSMHEKREIQHRLREFAPPVKFLYARNLMKSLAILWSHFGKKSRWNYFLLDLDAKTAIVIHNLMDLPSEIGVEMEAASLMGVYGMQEMAIESLTRVSEGYSNKYEKKTHLSSDLHRAIEFKKALLAIYRANGDINAYENCMEQITEWETQISSN